MPASSKSTACRSGRTFKTQKKSAPEETSDRPGQVEQNNDLIQGLKAIRDRQFALAAASLRQALQDLPEITELSKHIMFTETKEGLNIEIVDQDGRSMFPEGAKEPYDRTRKLLVKIAEIVRAMPHRVIVAGHTAALRTPPKGDYGAFDLSADRANVVRSILQGSGVRAQQIFMVAGRADSEPLVPRRSLYGREPPRDDYAAQGSARRSAEFAPLICA